MDVHAISIASTTLGSLLLMTAWNFYYVKVFVSIHKISQLWLTIAQCFSILWNILIQPLAGFSQDFGPAAFRRRRNVILVSAPFLVGAFLAAWFPWFPDGHRWLAGVQLIVCMIFYYGFLNMMLSAYFGLFAELSTDNGRRVRTINYVEASGILASLILFPMDKFSSSLVDYDNYQYLCVAISVAALACFIFTGTTATSTVAQRRPTIEMKGETKVETAGELVRDVFKNRNFWCTVCANSLHYFRRIASENFLIIFTELFVPQTVLTDGSYAHAAFYTLCAVGPRVIVISLSGLSKRVGICMMLKIGCVCTLLNSSLALLFGLHNPCWKLAFLFIEATLAHFQVYLFVMLTDVIDEDAKSNNRKLPHSVAIFSLNMAVVKTTLGLTPLIIVASLSSLGFDVDENLSLNSDGTASCSCSLAFLFVCVYPAVCALLELVPLALYRHRSEPAK